MTDSLHSSEILCGRGTCRAAASPRSAIRRRSSRARRILEAVVAGARACLPAVARDHLRAPPSEPCSSLICAPRRIQTLRQREETIEAIGIENLLVIPFTRDFSLTRAEDFVRDFLSERLAVADLHVGDHFTFGGSSGGTWNFSGDGPDAAGSWLPAWPRSTTSEADLVDADP